MGFEIVFMESHGVSIELLYVLPTWHKNPMEYFTGHIEWHELDGVKVGRINSPPRGVSCAQTGESIEMPFDGWLMRAAQGSMFG